MERAALIALSAAYRSEAPVGFFTLESDAFSMGRCILGKISGAGSYRLCAGELRESDWLKISDAMKRLSEMNLFMAGPIRHAVMEEFAPKLGSLKESGAG